MSNRSHSLSVWMRSFALAIIAVSAIVLAPSFMATALASPPLDTLLQMGGAAPSPSPAAPGVGDSAGRNSGPPVDWSAVAAVGAILAVIGAVWAAWYQSQRSAFANGVNLATELFNDLGSVQGLALRRAAAAGLLVDNTRFSPELWALLVKLEVVGLLLRRNAIDMEVTWSLFSTTVFHYLAAANPIITAERAQNGTSWADLLHLRRQLADFERRRSGTTPSPGFLEVSEFLAREAAL